MSSNRENIEWKILHILKYINNKKLAIPLGNNINLFSLKELTTLLDFLESWKLEIIYKLLDEKYKEYLWIMEKVKMTKISNKKNEKLQEERRERDKEQEEIEQLINF